MTDQGKATGNEAIEWRDENGQRHRLIERNLDHHYQPEHNATTAELEAAGFIRKPTPEPGEPVGGKVGPAETAGEATRILLAERASELLQADARIGELQSALTRAEGRVKELERTVDIVVGDLCSVRDVAMERAPSLVFAAINGAITRLRAQPPLASPVDHDGKVNFWDAARESGVPAVGTRWSVQADRTLLLTVTKRDGDAISISYDHGTGGVVTHKRFFECFRPHREPLASSVVADEATTGEAEQVAILDALDAADDAARARQEAGLGAVDEATTGEGEVTLRTGQRVRVVHRDSAFDGQLGTVSAIKPHCIAVAIDGESREMAFSAWTLQLEPSPLTGEEGKAERVDYDALAYVRDALRRSSQASRSDAPEAAFRELRIAVRRIAEHLESRAAKERGTPVANAQETAAGAGKPSNR